VKRPEIWTPVREKTQSEAKARLKELAKNPDVDKAEVWMDGIEDLDIPDLFSTSPISTIAANKMPVDKGNFTGTHEELADQLLQAAEHGAGMIALPVHAPMEVFAAARRDLDRIIKETRREILLIAEYHNWSNTPSEEELKRMADAMLPYADVIKDAVTPETPDDVERIKKLAKYFRQKGILHILISMKDMGRDTRVETPLEGGLGMFAPVKIEGATAGGQLTVTGLVEAWRKRGYV
jgi:3-dehydroquinate dehydratase type I